ncbi:MAG: U32 family peptidase [Spirochaetes bacterium]|nr:U32 family peptidase [Spirochaetota bacterium]
MTKKAKFIILCDKLKIGGVSYVENNNRMINKKPELLAPAGSFMSAYYAYQAGADAVYLGLADFSARKSAQNFNNNELLKLKKIALDLNRKIYVAINTVVKEEELVSLIKNLQFINRLKVDAVIVQDFGVLELLRRFYPDIIVHASTQMAIHNEYGIEKAIELGVKRIVLPREMSVKTVKMFIKKYKEMEFEVFIHGSLCYSYSGLCLSSGLLRGKSGNRGECTQPCREKYSYNGESGAFFSCRDLSTGRLVEKLIDIGVDSFKIEGRQKNPEYIYNTVKLYRYLIDNNGKLKKEIYNDLLQNCEFVFSRQKTNGYLFKNRNTQIITEKYARNMGSPIGFVAKASEDSFSFKTKSKIETNDVLLFFLNKKEKIPYKIPVRRLTIDDKIITIYCDKIPDKGQKIYKAYSKNLELSGVTHRAFPAYRKTIRAEITFLGRDKLVLRIDCFIDGETYKFEYPVSTETSAGAKGFKERIQKALSAEADAFYAVEVLEVKNETLVNEDCFYFSNTMLQGLVKNLYHNLEKINERIDSNQNETIANYLNNIKPPELTKTIYDYPEVAEFVSKRSNINVKKREFPFFLGNKIDFDSLEIFVKYYFISMKPIIYDKKYYKRIEGFIKNNRSNTIFLGINNISHLKIIEQLGKYKNVYFFIDFYFYTANRFTLLNKSIDRTKVLFAYYWIEGDGAGYKDIISKTDFPLFQIESDYNAPLFLHNGIFTKESLKRAKIGAGDTVVTNGDDRYRVYENDGFSYVFKVK